jgi:predicted nucleic acid-binding protein
LLALPHVQSPGEQERFWPTLRGVAAEASARGNLVPDAHVVALMKQNDVPTIFTHDRDFRRFDGIAVRDPLV